MKTPSPTCPRCQSVDVDETEQNGSSQRWFECGRCGHRWPDRAASPSR